MHTKHQVESCCSSSFFLLRLLLLPETFRHLFLFVFLHLLFFLAFGLNRIPKESKANGKENPKQFLFWGGGGERRVKVVDCADFHGPLVGHIGIIVSLNDQYTGVVVERLQREEGGK